MLGSGEAMTDSLIECLRGFNKPTLVVKEMRASFEAAHECKECVLAGMRVHFMCGVCVR
jgi:hypothetical protein